MCLLLMEFSFKSNLMLLAILYLMTFLMVLQVWPIALASVKLISGWMAVLVLGIMLSEKINTNGKLLGTAISFRIISALLFSIFIYLFAPELLFLIPIDIEFIILGLQIFFLSILALGFFTSPIQQLFAWLTLLMGFEVIYSPLEGSALLAAILALFHIGIALVGSYIILTTQSLEESQP